MTCRCSGTVAAARKQGRDIRDAALAAYEGKRARKGKKQDVMVKAMRVLSAPSVDAGHCLCPGGVRVSQHS